jgi:hypothetical protein
MIKETQDRLRDREFKRIVRKALDALIKRAGEEPAVILEIGSASSGSHELMKEISSWLFRRRQEDGNSNGNPR